MKEQPLSEILNNQRGVSAVIIGICLFMLVGFVALAIDVGHLYVVRNELQNAADAGALAGARHLYVEGAFLINENANLIGAQAATANIGDNKNVEIINPASNADDVQRGHWTFATRSFNREDGLIPPAIWGKSAVELDLMTDFVNAVQVITRRESLPITSFFAGIFGFTGFKASRKAVAYLSASSAWLLKDFDMPIAICAQSLVPPGEYESELFEKCIQADTPASECPPLDYNIGRMLNSGSNTATHNTAGWTNFSGGRLPGEDPEPCSTASASDMTELVDTLCRDDITPNGCDFSCTDNNAESNAGYNTCCKQFAAGDSIGTTGGVQQVTLDSFRDCWVGGCNSDYDVENSECLPIDSEGGSADDWNMKVPEEPWALRLPVVDCPGNNVSNCSNLIGAVTVSLVWITRAGTPDPSLDTPYRMKSTNSEDEKCGKSEPVSDWPTDGVKAQTLDDLKLEENGENRGIPEKYFEPVEVSCSDEVPPNPQNWPSEIPALKATDRLDSSLHDLLAGRLSDGYSINDVISSEGKEKIAPLSQADASALEIQIFDFKDPGDPAPNKPNDICSLPEYEQLLLHHLADAAGEARWASFVDHFGIKNWDNNFAPLAKKSLYFLPTCCGVPPTGLAGDGAAFGIMARVPVLVD